MKRSGADRRRSNGSGGIERSGNRSFKGRNTTVASEFVEVPTDLKGHVIGKKGKVIEGIREESGARVVTNSDQEGFTINGTEEQRACARRLINQKLLSVKEETQKRHRRKEGFNDVLILIPMGFMGLVIGNGGDTLRSISTKTGARLRVDDERSLYARGSEKAVQHAALQIRHLVAGARLKTVKSTCFIDDWNLPDGCELKLIPVREEEHFFLPGSTLQYRLKATEEYELTATGMRSRSDTSRLQTQLRHCAMETLLDIKRQMESTGRFRADMWCHFGIVVIREPDEDDIDEAWSTRNAEQKVNQWKVAFKEGVYLDENFLTNVFGEEVPEEYVARHDLTFITPSCHSVRCKVWIARKGLEGNLEEIPIPFCDVKNVVQKINFNDNATKSRCRGWLVLPSRKHFQADIIFPGCESDFRITIRTETTGGPLEEETRLLSCYLSKLMMSDDNEADLHLPQEQLPKGFHLRHRRCSHRTLYTPRDGYAVLVSKERTWSTDGINEECRKTTDLHLHCEEWDRALGGEDWEPEEIVDKLPDFLDFVQRVQELLFDCTKRNE